MVVVAVVVRRLPQQGLGAGQSLRLGRNRVLECQGLDPPARFMVVVGEGAVHRVSQYRDELHVGIESRDPLRSQGMDHVVG